MNIFLKCLTKTLLASVLFATGVGFAAEETTPDVIEFRNVPGWTTENYLTFLLTKIPLAQMKTTGDTIQVTGPVRVAFKNFSEELKVELAVELSRAFKGERQISGAVLDANGAQLELVEDLSAAVANRRHMTMEELGFVHTPVDAEQIKRETEQRQRREAQQLSEGRSCGRLLGHIEK